MRCRDYTHTDCPGYLDGLYSQWSRRGGQMLIWRCPTCGATNEPRKPQPAPAADQPSSDRTERTDGPEPQPPREDRTVKVILCVNRKSGAPNYSSDGASAQIEHVLEIDDLSSAEQQAAVSGFSATWYPILGTMVEAELRRQSAAHPQQTVQQPAQQAPQHRDDRFPVGPPQRRRPQPEPGWDADDEPEQQYQPPPRSSAPPPAANGQGRSYGPPTNGRQLMAAVGKLGLMDQLKRLSKDVDRGMIQDWPEDLVLWAYQELTRKQQQPAGQWGRN